jgi:hypothetical protein
MGSANESTNAAASAAAAPPSYRPLERFWPYVDVPEQPSDEELAALDPDLAAALFGAPRQPFSVTFSFAPFDGPDYERAVALARAAVEYREIGTGAERRHRARFRTEQVAAMRELWRLIGRFDSSEVLVDDQPVPYARELWLPLLWLLDQ